MVLEPPMRISELARRSGLSRDTLRFYERQGLIRSMPGPVSTNNYRDYSEDTVLTLELIAEAQAVGMTIADLSIFISQLQAADTDGFDGEAFLQVRIREIEDRISRAQKFLETLKATQAALASAEFPEPN